MPPRPRSATTRYRPASTVPGASGVAGPPGRAAVSGPCGPEVRVGSVAGEVMGGTRGRYARRRTAVKTRDDVHRLQPSGGHPRAWPSPWPSHAVPTPVEGFARPHEIEL